MPLDNHDKQRQKHIREAQRQQREWNSGEVIGVGQNVDQEVRRQLINEQTTPPGEQKE